MSQSNVICMTTYRFIPTHTVEKKKPPKEHTSLFISTMPYRPFFLRKSFGSSKRAYRIILHHPNSYLVRYDLAPPPA